VTTIERAIETEREREREIKKKVNVIRLTPIPTVLVH